MPQYANGGAQPGYGVPMGPQGYVDPQTYEAYVQAQVAYQVCAVCCAPA